jgi:DNA-binding response OmpR family regulator
MNKKILIIDDEEHDRKGMSVTLQKAGYRDIEFAETGEEGIEKAQTFKPDIVLVDVVLHSVDGIDVCREIKSIEGLTPKVIIVTGRLDAVNAAKARASGADELIEKEFGYENILKTIERLDREGAGNA